MANGSNGEHVDLGQLRELAALMKEFDLTDVELRRGGSKMRLTRGGGVVTEVRSFPSSAPPVAAHPGHSSSAGTVGAGDSENRNITYVKSPMVGTFYSRPNPSAEPFVKVGDFVDPERTVCIIEAMKVFNEIPAEIRGRIVAVLVGDEEPVEFGKPLFKVDTAG